MRELVATFDLPYPQVRDRDLFLTRRFDVKGTPTLVVIGAEGVLYEGHGPPEDWNTVVGNPTP